MLTVVRRDRTDVDTVNPSLILPAAALAVSLASWCYIVRSGRFVRHMRAHRWQRATTNARMTGYYRRCPLCQHEGGTR